MINNLYNVHHKIKMQLDAICQEAGDMDVEEFILTYNDICLEKENQDYSKIRKDAQELADFTYEKKYALKHHLQADKVFQEDMISDMDMGQ